MPSPTNHAHVMTELKKAQDADLDNRERAREAHLFLDKRDGQWEPYWWKINDGKPRYTFDLTTPVINQITGKLKKADFAGKIDPMGGEASKEHAEIMDGVVRNIQDISQAVNIYNSSGRGMVISGIDGWEIVQAFHDSDSFDQDLIIQNVENFVDRVWFNAGAERQDRSDAMMGWKFTGFSPEKYKEKWPQGKAQSMNSGRVSNAYFNKPDLIMVAEFYWVKEVMRELVLMSNNSTYVDDDKFKKVKKELKDLGIVEVRRRKRKANVVMTRKLDAGGFLDKPKQTVFEFIPLIPTYANYKIFDGKTIYYGAVEKRLDPQRVFNYTISRQVEEGALAPRAKYWLTKKQAEGNTDTLETLNTNADPVQIYNPDPLVINANPPIQTGGAAVNAGLQAITATVGPLISQTAGLFEANLGDNVRAQSGVAIDSLKDQGDVGTIDYFESQEIAICHTMRILVKAIPKVYVGERLTRVLKEDGSADMVTLNEPVFDEETKKDVVLNDLSKGSYSVTCSAGKSFQNQQQETVSAMVEIGSVNPAIVQIGSDILLNNVTAPGMNLLAARERKRLFESGVIPIEQWTDEEKDQVELQTQQAAEQPPKLSPEEMIGQAELITAQNRQKETDIKVQVDGAKIGLAQQKEQREGAKDANQAANDRIDRLLKVQERQTDQNDSIINEIKTQAETLKIIVEAMGVEAVVTPTTVAALKNQADGLIDSQNQNGT